MEMMPVSNTSDTEALVESDGGHVAARGVARPLRTLVIAASVLGLAFVAVARWTSPQNLASIDGFMKKDAESSNGTADDAKVTCSAAGKNCTESKCCSEPGLTCFEKNAHWSSCNETCSPKMLWTGKGHNGWEEQNETIWNCTVVSDSSAVLPCTANGQNCAASKCCLHSGSTCFKKNEEWASCNDTCSPKMLWTTKGDNSGWEEQNETIWDCDNLSLEDAEELESAGEVAAKGQGVQHSAGCRNADVYMQALVPALAVYFCV